MEATTAQDTAAQPAIRDFEALSKRDAAGMQACYAEDAVVDLGSLGILRGSTEIRAFFDSFFAAVPDLETTWDLLATSGNKAVIEWRMRGTFTGATFQDLEPTGKQLEIRGVDVMTLDGDHIVHNTAYSDGMEFARQVGMMPARDSGAEKAMIAAFNASTKLRARFANR